MSFWDLASKVVDAGVNIYNNYQQQQQQNYAQSMQNLSRLNNIQPKILDNYRYGMNLNTIASENGVYSLDNPSIDFQLARDEYYFCRYPWGQLFFFKNNSLRQIKLVHPWDANCYSTTVQTIGHTCSIMYVESNRTYCDIFNASYNDMINNEDEFIHIVSEIEKEGLENDHLIIYYIDNWVFDYFRNYDSNWTDTINNKDATIMNLPNNARLIQVIVDKEDIVVDFIHPSLLKQATF